MLEKLFFAPVTTPVIYYGGEGVLLGCSANPKQAEQFFDAAVLFRLAILTVILVSLASLQLLVLLNIFSHIS